MHLMNDTILIIDDDANLLAAMQRQLRSRFSVKTVQGGEETIALLADKRLYPAVVLCDMRMGGMDGIKTLRKVQELVPDAVRLMLTGNADLQTAIDAINTGNIFRFLTKPCSLETLEAGLAAALRQYRLVTAERELLEQTLAGSVKVLSDMLSVALPKGYSQAARIQGWVRKLVAEGVIPQSWQLDLAAMLAPLGTVSLSDEILTKIHRRAPLSEMERSQLERTPETARKLIANIPRMRGVAEIVYLQNRGFDGSGFPADGPVGSEIPVAARVLKILNDLCAVSSGAAPTVADFAVLASHAACYDPELFRSVHTCLAVANGEERNARRSLQTARLIPGMCLAEDIASRNGQLVLAASTPLCETHIERLRNLAQDRYIEDTVIVFADYPPVSSPRPMGRAS
jgi:response regulator RpfG family c-di-GMP phosphodiesterase